MEINITQLRKNPGDTLEFHFNEDIGTLSFNDEQFLVKGPVDFQGKIINAGRLLQVRGKIVGTVNLQCSRCLDSFDYNIKTSFEESYCHENDVAVIKEEGIEEEECNIFKGEKIDFIEDVKECLALSIPMKPVCKEECKGICPQCGQNLNLKKCDCIQESIDHRFEVLKKLL